MAEPDTSKLPPLKDLTIENITENVQLINSQCKDARARFVFERLVWHMHEFARETRLSSEEWMTGIDFLTRTGQKCNDLRQEYILLSDVLGLSILIDNISHPKPAHSTAGTVFGPFHTHDAHVMPNGELLSHDETGEPLLCVCSITNTSGKPVENCKIDIWETDSNGLYDVQRANRKEPDGRAVMYSDTEGKFWFKSIVPVEYPIPTDGPVGELLRLLDRHAYRPAHMHFMFEKEGYDKLVTALYVRGDKFENSDAVFGVKDALLVDIATVSSEQAKNYGVPEGTKLLSWDFILVSEQETRDLRQKEATEAVERMGADLSKMKIIDGLPVPDVD